MSDRLVISLKECENLRWQPPSDMAFAANMPMVQLHIGELSAAATSMPMAFVQKEGLWQLVAVCGHTANCNLFVRDGNWLGAYTPQVLANGPFELVWVGERGFMTFDKAGGALVKTGGEPFFDHEGNLGTALQAVRRRLEVNAPQVQAVKEAIASLQETGVLKPWPASLTARLSGFDLSGLFHMNEQALAKLSDSDFLTLRRNGALALGYAVNLSLGQVHMLERLLKLNPSATTAKVRPTDDLEAFFDGDDNLSF